MEENIIIMPMFAALMITLIVVIASAFIKKDTEPVKQELINISHRKSIYRKNSYGYEIYNLAYISLILMLFLALLDSKYTTYIVTEILKNTDKIQNILASLTTLSVTMALVVVVFDKKYYILFSMSDVLKKYKVPESIVVAVFTYIVCCVIQIALLGNTVESILTTAVFIIYQIMVIYNMISNTYILCIMITILFFDEKKELNLLQQLYRRFWISKVDINTYKKLDEWDVEALEINIEYLIEQYMKLCKKSKISKIKYMEFSTIFGIYERKWYKKARRKFVGTISIVFIATIGTAYLLNIKSIVIYGETFLMYVITIFLGCIPKTSVKNGIIRIFYDSWGYYVWLGDKKEHFIPRIAVGFDNVYNRFINIMNSINAFFYILLESGNDGEKNKEKLENIVRKVIKCFDEDKNISNVTYMPIMVVGYFLFQKQIVVNEIKNVYLQKYSKDTLFVKSLYSQLYYLTINDYEKEENMQKAVHSYLNWLMSS